MDAVDTIFKIQQFAGIQGCNIRTIHNVALS